MVQGRRYNVMKKPAICQAEGCCEDLAAARSYCLKRRLCSQHLKADAVRRKGRGDVLWRFCFQCGKLEQLEMFDGSHRNCRASLLKRQQQAAPRRSTCRQLHGSGSTVPKECAKPQLQVKQDWDDLLGAWPLGGSALGAAEPMELAPSCEAGAGAVATNQLVEEILAEMFDAEVAGAAEQAPARSSFSRSSSVSSDHELEAMIEDELRAAALAASQPGAGRPTLAPQAAAPAPSTAELLQQEWAAAVAMPPHAGGCLPACVVAAQPGPQRVERLQGLLEQYQQLQATIEQLRIHVTQLCAAVPAC